MGHMTLHKSRTITSICGTWGFKAKGEDIFPHLQLSKHHNNRGFFNFKWLTWISPLPSPSYTHTQCMLCCHFYEIHFSQLALFKTHGSEGLKLSYFSSPLTMLSWAAYGEAWSCCPSPKKPAEHFLEDAGFRESRDVCVTPSKVDYMAEPSLWTMRAFSKWMDFKFLTWSAMLGMFKRISTKLNWYNRLF